MKEKLIIAKKLYEKDKFTEVIETLLPLKELNDAQEKYRLLLLSHSYFCLNDFVKSYVYAGLISQKDKSNEFASQLKYLCLVSQNKINEALSEIINYLNDFPGNLYKTTLEELLVDVNEKRIGGQFADQILFLANKNKI